MIKNIIKSLQETTEIIVEKAAELNDAAKEKIHDAKELTKDKVLNLIEEWIIILPKLSAAGLDITSFGVGMSLNPSLLVEMKGLTRNFEDEKMQQLLDEHSNEKAIKLILNAIKTAMLMHKKAGLPLR